MDFLFFFLNSALPAQAFLQFHFSQGLLSLERRKEEKEEQEKQQYNNNRVKDETRRNDGDGDDDGSKLKHKSTHNDALDRNASDVTSTKNTIKEKEELEERKNHFEKYGNSENNLNRLVEMLTFLLAFFKEINPDHKLLEPISDTLEETKIRLEEEFKIARKESK